MPTKKKVTSRSRTPMAKSKKNPNSPQPGDPMEPRTAWTPTSVEESDLHRLVEIGVLPVKDIVGWEAQEGRMYPKVEPHTMPVFTWYFLRGLGLPICSFLKGLLHYYSLELPHLNPNSILQIAVFMHLCEAFLGIAPHFNLWRYLYLCKHQIREGSHQHVGGAGFQLRDHRKSVYLDLPLPQTNKDWTDKWFVMENIDHSVPPSSGIVPLGGESWTELPSESEMDDVEILLERIAHLKDRGLTAMAVAVDFVYRSIQPLKDRIHLAYHYAGINDPTREVNRQVTTQELHYRVRSFFSGRITNHGCPQPFSLYNLPPKGECFKFLSEPPMPEDAPSKAYVDPVHPGVTHDDREGEEPPAGFYPEFGEADVVADPPAPSEQVEEEAPSIAAAVTGTRAATSRARKVVQKRPLKQVTGKPKPSTVVADKEEVESDKETLITRKRRRTADGAASQTPPVQPQAPTRPKVKFGRSRPLLPPTGDTVLVTGTPVPEPSAPEQTAATPQPQASSSSLSLLRTWS